MKKILLLIVCLLMNISISNAESVRIVAVVNDDVITTYDFYNRVNMAIMNSNMEKSQESFQKVAPFVLQELIQENLKHQTAKKAGFNVSSEKVEEILIDIANKNGLNINEFKNELISSGIEIDTLKDQIVSNVLWQEYIKNRIAPQVNISDDEVNELMQKLKGSVKSSQYLIEEIFFHKENFNTGEILEEFLIELEENPDKFSYIAEELSEAPNKGKMDWVMLDGLSPEIKDFASIMKVGEISPVIESEEGFSIIKLVDKRKSDVKDISEEDVRFRLSMEEVDILQKRKLRDLKDSAFIEVKIK